MLSVGIVAVVAVVAFVAVAVAVVVVVVVVRPGSFVCPGFEIGLVTGLDE